MKNFMRRRRRRSGFDKETGRLAGRQAGRQAGRLAGQVGG